MDLDPYEELGVARSADQQEIKRGYRRRARKTHPDVPGGSAEKFARTKTALVVLSEPLRRKRYDETGGLDENAGERQADNERAGALQMIEEFLNRAIDAWFSNTPRDPRKRDLVEDFCKDMNAKISSCTVQDMQGAKVLEFIGNVGKRFKTEEKDDPIGRSFRNKIAQIEASRAELRQTIAMCQLAIKIARKYRFEYDRTEPNFGMEFQILGVDGSATSFR